MCTVLLPLGVNPISLNIAYYTFQYCHWRSCPTRRVTFFDQRGSCSATKPTAMNIRLQWRMGPQYKYAFIMLKDWNSLCFIPNICVFPLSAYVTVLNSFIPPFANTFLGAWTVGRFLSLALHEFLCFSLILLYIPNSPIWPRKFYSSGRNSYFCGT